MQRLQQPGLDWLVYPVDHKSPPASLFRKLSSSPRFEISLKPFRKTSYAVNHAAEP